MKNKGFTLIELLTVIAVIGLISSVILVSLKGTTGRARIAKGLSFSHSVQHVLGAYAVGVWSFDNQTLDDGSGYGNHGTCTNCPIFTTDTPSGEGYGLIFDGSNDYVDCGNDANLDTSDVTIEAWVKLTDVGSWFEVIYSRGDAAFRFGISGSGWGGDPWMRISSPTGPIDYKTADGDDDFQPHWDKWTHIAFVFSNSQDLAQIHINGSNIYSNTSATATPSFPEEANIGRNPDTQNYHVNGLIDEVRVYGAALTASQIKQHYVWGLERHRDIVSTAF